MNNIKVKKFTQIKQQCTIVGMKTFSKTCYCTNQYKVNMACAFQHRFSFKTQVLMQPELHLIKKGQRLHRVSQVFAVRRSNQYRQHNGRNTRQAADNKEERLTPVKLYTGLFIFMFPFIFGTYMVEHPISISIPVILFSVPQTRKLLIQIWDTAMQDEELSFQKKSASTWSAPPPPPPPPRSSTYNVPPQNFQIYNDNQLEN
eukprot:TRINITY_DN2403_c0_g1_i1.p2 TRINITY_DN2403_c0_g1~~TRINITY_DN2403_c0_g1_i1.p2  ORF type:complete len:202 (+),score=4.24 TRINITY_DN2403_c0_g1_i1:447-1052(+)